MTLRPPRLLSVVALLGLLAAACSNGDPDAVLAPTPAVTATADVSAEETATPAPDPAATTPPQEATATPRQAPVALEPGNAPWESAAVSVDRIPSFLVEAWQGSPAATCPVIWPDDIATLDQEAVARSAAFPGWGVAWDRPDGPGREPSGEYCEDCGRSTFGLAPLDAPTVIESGPERLEGLHVWDDGSRVGWFHEGFGSLGTGAPLLAHLEIPQYGCSYQVWSFRGEAGLFDLIRRIRFVEGLVPGPDSADPPPWAGEAVAATSLDPVYLAEWAEANAPATSRSWRWPSSGPMPRAQSPDAPKISASPSLRGIYRTGLGTTCSANRAPTAGAAWWAWERSRVMRSR